MGYAKIIYAFFIMASVGYPRLLRAENFAEFQPCASFDSFATTSAAHYRATDFGSHCVSHVFGESIVCTQQNNLTYHSSIDQFLLEAPGVSKFYTDDDSKVFFMNQMKCEWKNGMISKSEMTFVVPPQKDNIIQLAGFTDEATQSSIQGEVTIQREDIAPWTDPRTTIRLQLSLVLDSDAHGYQTISSKMFDIKYGERRTLSIWGNVPPGYSKVTLMVSDRSPTVHKAIRFITDHIKMMGVKSRHDIEKDLAEHSERAKHILGVIDLAASLHAEYVNKTDALLCSSMQIVDEIQNATEALLNKTYSTAQEWFDDAHAKETYYMAQEVLLNAQQKGAFGSDLDPWMFYDQNRQTIISNCQQKYPDGLVPDKAYFQDKDAELKAKGEQNVDRYNQAVDEYRALRTDALELTALIHVALAEYPSFGRNF